MERKQLEYRYFLDQHNEYDSRVSILDDETLRLSLVIDDDDDSHPGELSAPSLHLVEPKVYLRFSGESGMIRPIDSYKDQNNVVVSSQNVETRDRTRINPHHHETEIEEDQDTECDNYIDPLLQQQLQLLSQNKFEEGLENVVDLNDEHSKYFVKTKPRSETVSRNNIYSNFYYEPPSFSTKSVLIPVKTNRKLFVFASAKPPTQNSHHENSHNHDDTELSHQDRTTTFPNDDSERSYEIQAQQNNAKNKTLDVFTSQSILSKVTLNGSKANSDSKMLEREETSVSSTAASISSGTSTTEATTTTTDATSIPGTPGVDYPIFYEIPQTGFDCKNQRYKGFFADIDTKCQAWHYCDFTDGHSTFLCPNGTLFSQVLLTCDWWFNVDCDQARQLYVLNERLYRYIKPPKPSFPEDFTGEHVDKWLIQQWQMGLLPKVRKRSKAKLATLPPPRIPSCSRSRKLKKKYYLRFPNVITVLCNFMSASNHFTDTFITSYQ
ncbi:hypothetical protein Ocin01_10594 [Orchesella cincta]|uniref:Chitin-binding type-2 domain-containing protein n=1 Tax=Orchesella cincta TaxID=48709 RepID=A0A1D2MT59_ORCCI|nr:hypothetical protein Ocin01_10594 [Orchesella cincta]